MSGSYVAIWGTRKCLEIRFCCRCQLLDSEMSRVGLQESIIYIQRLFGAGGSSLPLGLLTDKHRHVGKDSVCQVWVPSSIEYYGTDI